MVDYHRWVIDCSDSKLLINKLNDFFIQHQALSKALEAAQPLGTCKITTSKGQKSNFRTLDSMLENGKNSIKTVTTHTNVELRGTG